MRDVKLRGREIASCGRREVVIGGVDAALAEGAVLASVLFTGAAPARTRSGLFVSRRTNQLWMDVSDAAAQGIICGPDGLTAAKHGDTQRAGAAIGDGQDQHRGALIPVALVRQKVGR